MPRWLLHRGPVSSSANAQMHNFHFQLPNTRTTCSFFVQVHLGLTGSRSSTSLPNTHSFPFASFSTNVTQCCSHSFSLVMSSPATANSYRQVTDYLVKKGFNRTNAIFTQEIRDLDESGKPRPSADLRSAGRFRKAFTHLEKWVENGLDLHKVSCRVSSPSQDIR